MANRKYFTLSNHPHRRYLAFLFLCLCGLPIAQSSTTAMAPLIGFLLDDDRPSPTFGNRSVTATAVELGTLFGAPDGSGNTCSKASPCNIETAIASLSAGSVLFLRGGIYIITRHLNVVSSGTAQNPIIIESYPGELAILDGQNETAADVISGNFPTGPGLWLHTNNNYISIRKIEIRNMSEAGIAIASSHNRVEGCNVHHNHYNGIHIIDGENGYTTPYINGYNTVQDNTVHHNSDIGLNTAPYNDGGNSDGISVSSSKFNRILHNTVYLNSDDGIDTWRSNDAFIAYNRVYKNGLGTGNGNGIKAGSSTDNVTGLRARAEHNLSYDNRTRGLNSNSGSGVIFRYNTAYNNGSTGFKSSDGAVVEYNIATDINGDANTITRAGHAFNSWQQAGAVAFISLTPTSADFLKPLATSNSANMGAYSHP